MKYLLLTLISILVTIQVRASADKRAWQRISDPLIMGTNLNRAFAALPTSGRVADPVRYWSSDYWARKKGGINFRWNSSRPTGFNLVSPTKEQALNMSQSELAALAPTEKWDLLNGRYDYPSKREVANYASPSRPLWEGICDGWAGAAMNHDEPEPMTLANLDGIQIPFGSADIKGLLSWYYARKHSGGYAMMGYRCNGGLSTSDRCQHDMNAGSFHLILANRVGLQGLSFIADIDRGREVWNHLAWDYSTTIRSTNLAPRSTSAPGTKKVARVRTVVDYIFIGKNSWNPIGQVTSSRTYEYYLDLNAEGKIIGGDWISNQRPDFLWLERPVTRFGGLYSRLGELLNDRVAIPEAETLASEDTQI